MGIEEESIREVNFTTNVLLKSIIGKDLINNDNIAILELVKNSYDAGSRFVNVVFENLRDNDDESLKVYSGEIIPSDNETRADYTKRTSRIIIQDFGKGMDDIDLVEKWLNIAYSEKKYIKKEKDRVLAGAKGVGRFSCDRLGEFLNLYTRKKGKPIYHLAINWNLFEVQNKKDLTIQDIKLFLKPITEKQFKKETGRVAFEKGTLLEISKLRSPWVTKEIDDNKSKWNAEKILDLRNYLSKLLNPNQAFVTNKFRIFLVAKEFTLEDSKKPAIKKIGGEIKNLIFQELNFHTTSIESDISKDGKQIETTLKDKGRIIFKLIEKNHEYNLLSDIKIVLYYFNTYAKIYFAKETGIRTVDFGSIFLFINGFRVNPLGDVGNDWLSLEVRKGQGYARNLGTREVIGRIEITDPDSKFQIISSREGIVQDEKYRQIVKTKPIYGGYFYKTLKRLEKYVVEGLKWDRLPTREKTQEEDELEEKDGFLNQFKNKVKATNWVFDPEEEVYKEDQKIKDKRIFDLIHSIISNKNDDPANIISLYINENLISDIAREQTEKTQKEIKSKLKALSKQSPEQRVEFLRKAVEDIEKSDKEINIYLDEFSKYGTLDKGTKKAIGELEDVKDANKKLLDEIHRLEKEKKKLEEDIGVEKKKNLFLLATAKDLSPEALGMIHHIKIETQEIELKVLKLIDYVNANKYSKEEFLKLLSEIKLHSDKALKISKIVTVSDFNERASTVVMDMVSYIREYIRGYPKLFDEHGIEFKIEGDDFSYETRFSVLEVSVILDNLISNAKKARINKAEKTRIFVEFEKKQAGMILYFSDDGKGVSKEIQKNIFDLGVTETRGSGIGLYTVRDVLKRIKGNIDFIGNGLKAEGATFKLEFNKK